MILELKGIYKEYQQGKMKVPVLKNVDFSMEEGEYVAIMGESGSGKTTLLNILAALDKPTGGKVYLKGNDLSKIREKEMAAFRRQNLGFVFQDFNLLDTLTLKDNIFLPLVLSGKKYTEMESRIAPIAEQLGISKLLNKYPYEVSGGQKQKFLLARALYKDAPVLILDEPTNHLDITHQIMLMELVKKLNVTVISAIHDLNIAAAYCDKIYVLKDGVLEGYGTPQEVLTPELIKRIYQVDSEVVNDSRGKMYILFL